MVLGMIPMGFAADQTAGEILKGYELLAGDENGDLQEDQYLNRAEMMVILARMNGKYEEAKSFALPSSYNDLAGFGWAVPYIAYAELNEWTSGVGAGKFDPAGHVTLQMAAYFMVEALGYADPADFSWTTAVEKATSLGLLAGIQANAGDHVLRGDLFKVMLQTLNTDVKGEAVKLGSKLGVKGFVVPVPAELAVQSVTVINAAQLQIQFNKAVVEKSVINTDNDTLASNSVVTLSKISGDGATPVIDSNSLAALSADGKTLTITVTSGQLHDVVFAVYMAKDVVQAVDNLKYMPAYTSATISTKDTTSPTITKVAARNASTHRVTFSEPLINGGSWSFKYSNGDTADVTASVANVKKGYVDLTIGTADVGREITATVIGARDYASNLVSPNPATVVIAKGAKDGVKPVVDSVKPIALNKFEINFSEEVQNFEVSDIKIAGVAAVGSMVKDSDDKTLYTITLDTPRTPGLVAISLDAEVLTDLSGEFNAFFSKVVEFKADTTAPKVVKTEIKTDAGVEYLHITFDESVVKNPAKDLTMLDADQLKDYVTTSAKINLNGLTVVSGTDQKEYKVALNTVTYNGASLSKDAIYTVTFDGAFEDLAANDLGKYEFTFTRGTDTSSNKPAIVKTFDGDEAGDRVDNNGIKVINNNTLQVKFDRELSGATAVNANNYSVNGVVVQSATLLADNVVELKIQNDTNTLTGYRTISISGVQSKYNVTMDTFTDYEYLVENVRPTIKTAQLTTTTTIKLTLSEKVFNADNTAGQDFELYIDGSKVSGAVLTAEVIAAGAAKDTVELTISGYTLVASELSKLTIKKTDFLNITDEAGNKVNLADAVAVQ
jgi:hypothetical protein